MLLRQLLTAEEKNKAELKQSIIAILKDPGEILRSGILDTAHPLYLNAQLVDDALESVTNGMEDLALLKLLAKVPDDSIVGPWKRGVLAIQAFYRGKLSDLSRHREYIPEGTPPRKLADLAEDILTGKYGADGGNSGVHRFAAEILQSPDYIGAAGEQMEEALEMGMPDLFCDTAAMLLRDIEREYPAEAADFAVWAFSRLAAEDQSLMSLLKRFRPLFGEPGTYRLAALGVLEEDADAALFFWLKYITSEIEENLPDREVVAAALTIAAEIGERGTVFSLEEDAGENSAEDELLRQQFTKLLTSLSEGLCRIFPETESCPVRDPADCRTAASLIGPTVSVPETADTEINRSSAETRERLVRPKESSEPLQLELFA